MRISREKPRNICLRVFLLFLCSLRNHVCLTLWTGYRTSEVYAMGWDDMDPEKGTIQ